MGAGDGYERGEKNGRGKAVPRPNAVTRLPCVSTRNASGLAEVFRSPPFCYDFAISGQHEEGGNGGGRPAIDPTHDPIDAVSHTTRTKRL